MEHFNHLVKDLKEGEDYLVISKEIEGADLAVIAPHGGGIEPGTTEISRNIARDKYHYYSFLGKKYSGNEKLHLKSTLFDDPGALELLKKAETCLALHGCNEEESFVFTGGKNNKLLQKINGLLLDYNFKVIEAPSYLAAQSPHNICNLCRRGKGIQLELSYGLRKKMFENVDKRYGREKVTPVFYEFVEAVNKAVDSYCESIKFKNGE